MIYTLYFSRKLGDGDNDVVKWLEHYSKLMDYKNDIIMSPGYLTISKQKVSVFLEKLKQVCFGNENRSLGILNGMNGRHTVKGCDESVLQIHKEECDKDGNIKWLSLKSNGKVDHRKIMVFYSVIGKDEIVENIDNKDDIEHFLENVKVNAVLIGSSNQSFNTYFSQYAKKGEADVFMMAGTRRNVSSFNYDDVIRSMLADMKRLPQDNKFNYYDDNMEECVNFLNKHATVSTSVAGRGNENSEEFLKDILRDLLVDGIL